MVVGDVTLTEGVLTTEINIKHSLDNMHFIHYKRH